MVKPQWSSSIDDSDVRKPRLGHYAVDALAAQLEWGRHGASSNGWRVGKLALPQKPDRVERVVSCDANPTHVPARLSDLCHT